ncbi:NAD(P)-dependent oxidoreductase [Yinghuangia aomiensis]
MENVAYSPDSVADYTLMLILMALRHAKSTIRRSDLHDYRLHEARGKELRDLTVGVVGTGAHRHRGRDRGCAVSGAAYWRPTLARRPPRITWRSTRLLRVSDIVTLRTPLTADTRHLLGGAVSAG